MWVSPSSPSHALGAKGLQPSIVIHSPTQAVRGWRREVRYTLCPHIPSCRGASPTGRVPPSPHLLLIPCSQAGSTGGWAEMTCRGGAIWGDPTRGEEWHFPPPFMRQSLLEVSEIFQGNTRNISKPPQPGVHLSPEVGRWSS